MKYSIALNNEIFQLINKNLLNINALRLHFFFDPIDNTRHPITKIRDEMDMSHAPISKSIL